jgi:hypothetical protein
MKIKEFISRNRKYEGKQEDEIAEIMKEIELKNYIPISAKFNLIDKLADLLIIKNEDGFGTYDSGARYLYFTLMAIQMYTNLEFSFEDKLQANNKLDITELCNEYDLLMVNGWLFPIIENIGNDYKDFNSLLNMKWDERMIQMNSSEAVVNRVLGSMLLAVQEASLNITKSMIGSDGSITQILEQMNSKE